jgi:hypothetical protein
MQAVLQEDDSKPPLDTLDHPGRSQQRSYAGRDKGEGREKGGRREGEGTREEGEAISEGANVSSSPLRECRLIHSPSHPPSLPLSPLPPLCSRDPPRFSHSRLPREYSVTCSKRLPNQKAHLTLPHSSFHSAKSSGLSSALIICLTGWSVASPAYTAPCSCKR